MRKLNFIVSAEFDNHKLSSFLKYKGFSTRFITSLKHIDGAVKAGGRDVFMNYKIHTGEKIEIYANNKNDDNICPVDLPLDIIYEDEDIAVVNKDKGRPTHPSHRHRYDTLANALVYHWQKSGDDDAAFHPVHRLDMDTSGLILVAKNRLSAAILSEDIKNNKGTVIRRKYKATVTGEFLGDNMSGVIEKHIRRKENTIIEREICSDNDGEYARTEYTLLKSNGELSLVELELYTGRTHQIRVHMSALGHPLLGDNMYGGIDVFSDKYFITGQALVSYYIEFTHPITRKRMKFEIDLPQDMQRISDDI